MADLFGYEIKKKKEATKAQSFVAPSDEEGTLVPAALGGEDGLGELDVACLLGVRLGVQSGLHGARFGSFVGKSIPPYFAKIHGVFEYLKLK